MYSPEIGTPILRGHCVKHATQYSFRVKQLGCERVRFNHLQSLFLLTEPLLQESKRHGTIPHFICNKCGTIRLISAPPSATANSSKQPSALDSRVSNSEHQVNSSSFAEPSKSHQNAQTQRHNGISREAQKPRSKYSMAVQTLTQPDVANNTVSPVDDASSPSNRMEL
jgi:hypothetical protein